MSRIYVCVHAPIVKGAFLSSLAVALNRAKKEERGKGEMSGDIAYNTTEACEIKMGVTTRNIKLTESRVVLWLGKEE